MVEFDVGEVEFVHGEGGGVEDVGGVAVVGGDCVVGGEGAGADEDVGHAVEGGYAGGGEGWVGAGEEAGAVGEVGFDFPVDEAGGFVFVEGDGEGVVGAAGHGVGVFFEYGVDDVEEAGAVVGEVLRGAVGGVQEVAEFDEDGVVAEVGVGGEGDGEGVAEPEEVVV